MKSLRIITLLAGLMLALAISAAAQTTLISPTGDGGFETGADFPTNNWTLVNGTNNRLFVGATAVPSAGTNSAFSGINAATWNGEAFSSVNHFYRDITFPSGETNITLTFRYKVVNPDLTFDFLRVFLVPTTTTPVAGTQLASGQVGSTYDSSTSYLTQTITLPGSAAGTTQRLVFSWRTDSITPFASVSVDEINLVSAAPGNIVSTGTGGLWSAGTTWVGGVVPANNDNVTIADGATVTIDTSPTVTNLNVGQGASGILQYEATTIRTLTVNGDLTVAANGIFQSAATGTVTTHALNLAGNATNNGTIDFSTNTNTAGAQITFTGAANNSFTLGASSATDFRQTTGLTLNKGTSITSELTFNPAGTVTVLGANAVGFLSITNGLFTVGGTGTFSNPLFNAAAYTIPATGGFRLNNANANVVGQNNAATLAGFLRVSAGTLNIGTTNNSMAFNSGAVVNIDGGTINAVARFGVTSAATAITYNQSGGTVNVNTAGGNGSATLAAFDMGTSTSTSFTMSGGSVVVARGSANTELRGAAVGATVNITGGTFTVGNATTPAATTFRVLGNTPNLNVSNAGANNPGLTMAGTLIVRGDLTINGTGIFTNNFNSLTISGNSVANPGNITNSGTFTINTSNTQTLTFNSSFGNQILTNTGTITSNQIPTLTINNTFAGGTVTLPNGLSIMGGATVTLTAGTLTTATGITFGTGGALSFTVIRGNGAVTGTVNFNYGTGTVAYNYNGTIATTTGVELPTSITGTLTINNAGGVTLNAPLSAGLLTLTNGILNTTAANLLTATGTTAGSVSRTTGYVNGPLARTLPASLVTGQTYLFPVGKGTYNPFELVNTTTNAGGTVVVLAEVFDANSGGTAGTGIGMLNTNRYWSASITSGAGNFTNTAVRLTDSTITGANTIGQSATVNGTYNSIGGTVSGITILSGTTTSLGFFNIGTKGNLTGSLFAIGPNGPYAGYDQTFATMAAASTFLDGGNVANAMTFEFQSDYGGETLPVTFNEFGFSGGPFNVTFRPKTGVTVVNLGDPGTGNAAITFNGTDRIIFDGRPGGTGTTIGWTIRNTRTTATIGETIRFINGATNNTLTYLQLESQNTATATVLFSTSTTGTGNGNNTVSFSRIRDRSDLTGVPAQAIFSFGTAGVLNSNNAITNNEIFNWSSAGVFTNATGNGDGWQVNNNAFYQTATRTATLQAVSLGAGSGHTVNNNSIGGSDASRGGTAFTTSGGVALINLTAGTASASNIQGNQIGNIVSTVTSGSLYGIQVTSGTVNIGTTTGNVIGGTAANDIQVANSFDAIAVTAGTVDARNNTFRNLTYNAADYERSNGITITAGTVTYANNVIRDIINRGSTQSSLTNSTIPAGIRVNGGTNHLIQDNQIFNISLDFNGASGTATMPYFGIQVTGGTGLTVTRNNIYNLTTTRTGTTTSAPFIYGIYTAGASTGTYSNNRINIQQITASTQPLIRGIGIESTGNTNFYFNSIYIGGTAAAANNTYGLLRNTTSGTLDIRNNILSNERGGTGNHFGIGNVSATGWVSSFANFNDLYSANASNIGEWVGAANTFMVWKGNSGGDANSISANPLYVSTTDLHVQGTSPALSGGITIAGITTDIDSDPRPAANPDIGADEVVMAVSGVFPAGTYYNVVGAGGDMLGGNVIVTNSLTLTGIVTTGANTLTLGCAATTTGGGASSFVVGNLAKQYCATTGVTPFVYPVGDNTGTPEYSPFTANVTALATNPSTLTVSVTDGFFPSGMSTTESASRYWDVTETGELTATLAMTYLDADINGTEANYQVLRREGTTADVYSGGTVTPGTNTATAPGVMNFSQWGAGTLAPSAALVNIGGRVVTSSGRGVAGARVYMVDSQGNGVMRQTNPFGYYRYLDVPAGEVYVFSVEHKTQRFDQPSRVLLISDENFEINFTASGNRISSDLPPDVPKQ